MRLYVLPLGEVEVDVAKYMATEPERGERYAGPVAGFLIRTDDGTSVLVDTGLAPEHLDDPECRVPAPDLVVRMLPDDDIRHRLAEIDLKPNDIHVVVQTHFDFDHCGGNRFFPKARFVVQRDHYAFAKAHPKRCPAIDWDRPELRYELVDGDIELMPGIELVRTPGHAPGHQSVVVRGLRHTGTVVLAADAAHTHVELEEERLPGTADDAQLLASIRKVKAIRDSDRATVLVCHDVDAWAHSYRLSPDYYD